MFGGGPPLEEQALPKMGSQWDGSVMSVEFIISLGSTSFLSGGLIQESADKVHLNKKAGTNKDGNDCPSLELFK